MTKTWRWFGPGDKVTLDMMRQIGVEGVVTALHDIPSGEVWPEDRIAAMKALIESHGMKWAVVESLPVSEQIKYAGPERDRLIDNYIQSLENLGRCGIKTVCYNFMPVIDWVRTELEHPMPDGTFSLYFDYAKFAFFDIYILEREDAREDFPPEVLAKADELAGTMTEGDRRQLIDTIITKTQGFINGPLGSAQGSPVERFRALMQPYKGVSKDQFRENLKYFLEAIMPVCDKWGIDMCIHPDDPPMPVFGMPRICCDAADIRWILDAVPNPHNGLTFCAGSLSSGAHNDVEAMAREFAPRTRFVHLRSCNLLPGGDFVEAPHTAGRVDLVELIRIFSDCPDSLPMRVDHGKTMLGDQAVGYNPGYGFHGRMLALGQVEGMMAAVKREKQLIK
ncbi:MAG: mannonate dehydratase [Bacteroidales bacterium]|nr:mannonate dehydratase [Bacteroidales bacterium]